MVFLIFFKDEIVRAMSQLEIIIPRLFSALVPMAMFIYSFRLMGKQFVEYSATYTSGMLFVQLLTSALPAVIFLTMDFTQDRLYNYLSLPLSQRGLLLCRFGTSYLSALVISIVAFILPNIILYKIFDFRLVFVFTLFLLQIIIITGISLIASFMVKDLTKIGLALSLSTSILTYLSPAYFPIEIYPSWLKIIMYINPITLPVLFLRQLTGNVIRFDYLGIIIAETIIYFIISYAILNRKINKMR